MKYDVKLTGRILKIAVQQNILKIKKNQMVQMENQIKTKIN